MFRRPTARGFQALRPDSTTHTFQRLSKSAGVPVVPFHHLRHACASWLIEAGIDVVAVSERLGHWSPDFTLRVSTRAPCRAVSRAGPYHRGGAWLVFLHGSYMRLSAGTA